MRRARFDFMLGGEGMASILGKVLERFALMLPIVSFHGAGGPRRPLSFA